jgi:hypothetical protein
LVWIPVSCEGQTQEALKVLTFFKNHLFHIVLLLWVLNATARIVFGIMTITEGSLLDVVVPLATENTITVMFLTLGALGFIVTPGLALQRDWGLKLALLASLLTIGFDVWGMTIQFTAAMGFIVPMVMIVYIVVKKTAED